MNNIEVLNRELSTYVSRSLSEYSTRIYRTVKPTIDELKFKEQYQGRVIDCMVGEVDDNYIETPETDAPIVKLEHSKEGVVKIPSIKGKTILVDADGNETDTPAEGCRLVSVGESEGNKLIILSKNKNIVNRKVIDMGHSQGTYVTSDNGGHAMPSSIEYLPKGRYSFSIDGYDVSKFVDAGIYIWKEDLSTHTWRKASISNPFEILDGEVGFTWYGAVNKGAGETITPLVGKNIQVEQNEVRTSFVEPKQHKTEILLKEPLRSIPNGVQDEIVGNKIIRRVGSIILDGNKRVHVWNNSTGDTVNGYQYFHYYKEDNNVKNYCKIYNNILPSNKGGHIAKQEGFVYTNYIGFSIHKDRLGVEDVNDYLNNQEKVSQWFKDNRIEFLYELAEPVIEELPNGITLQGFNDTTMYVENSIIPTVTYGYNALIPYKEELSQQKEEVEINTLDIENNIIPYLLDMEFNLITMEDK